MKAKKRKETVTLNRKDFANLQKLATMAISIARDAPLNQGLSLTTKVPWTCIHQMRSDLNAAGIDWKGIPYTSEVVAQYVAFGWRDP